MMEFDNRLYLTIGNRCYVLVDGRFEGCWEIANEEVIRVSNGNESSLSLDSNGALWLNSPAHPSM